MDKKMVCGVLLTIIGLAFSVLFLILAALNPWDYNGISGLLGSLLGTHTFIPFVISFTVMAWSMRAFMTAVRRIRSRAWHRWRM